MRVFSLLIAAGLTFAGLTGTERTMYRYTLNIPMQKPTDAREHMRWLQQNGFDVAGLSWRQGTIEVIVDDSGIRRLTEHGYKGNRRHRLAAGLHDIDAGYLNAQKVEDQLKALNARYPERTRLQQIGQSLEGRAIWALLISSQPEHMDERPAMIFDGMHHARELMTSEVVMDAGEQLVAGAAENEILKRWDIWIVPMLNVDGNNRVWTTDSWWRKNTRTENADVYGVDLNRNYPFQWNTCDGSSADRAAETFHGSMASSEPETMALINLATQARPAASLSYHSYGEMVLYPYGCYGEYSGENAEFSQIARELATLLNYTPGTPWELLYSVDGDSMSYLHAEHGAIALSFEVGQDFQPSYSERQAAVELQRPAWRHFLEHVDQNLLTLNVVDSKTGAPVTATVDFTTIGHAQGEQPYRTSAGGKFFKVLAAGDYTVRIVSSDGRSTNVQVRMNGQAQGITVSI